METVDSEHMRTMNSQTLLKLIWQEQEISRAEISRVSGLSRSTVSAIVAELLQRGLVSEHGVRHSSSGRRPVMLSFHSDAYSIIGVDVGATHVGFALMNLKGMLRESRYRLCPVQYQPQQTMDIIIETIQSMQEAAERDGCPVIGVGVGLPCPVHPDVRRSPIHAGVLPAWKDFNPREILLQKFALPVLFDNDANLGTLAELWWAKEPARKNLAFIKLGTGVGAGLILAGNIHRGRHGLAGELGHMLALSNRGSPENLCNLNDVIGSPGVLKRAHELGRLHPHSLMAGCTLTVQRWLEAVQSQDPYALELFDEVAFALGAAIANLLAMLDLDSIVLSGNLQLSGERLLQKIRLVIQEHLIWEDLHGIDLRWSQLGDTQIALGAATMILEKAMSDLDWFPGKNPAVSHWNPQASEAPAAH